MDGNIDSAWPLALSINNSLHDWIFPQIRRMFVLEQKEINRAK
jgi:hypothetical protein